MSLHAHVNRDKSQQTTAAFRSKSQPTTDHSYSLCPSINAAISHPMKTYFANILHLTPHRYISPSNSLVNRTRMSKNSSIFMQSDRSFHEKTAQPSVISVYSNHSTNVTSAYGPRSLPTKLTTKFRQAGNLILFAIYWCKFAKKKNQQRSVLYQSYLQTTSPTEKYMFDRTNFKIESFEILSVVQQFFKQKTDERNMNNVEQIRKCLSDIKPFTRLPIQFQDQLLRQAWYERHPKQRTIVRQGERPSCFYIILSGSALPTYKRATDGNVETLDVLKRGCTFGEKGLMTDSTQSFTVTSKSEIELLVLWKEDFKSVFMHQDRHRSKDNIEFLKNNVPFLHGFPVDRLIAIPNAVQHCHFRQSEVIVKDSRRMKHLFIVKTGSLDVWKRLDPNDYRRKVTKKDSAQMEEPIVEGDDEATGDNRTLFSEIQLSGDINESSPNENPLDADFRLSRLRHASVEDQRISSALSVASRIVKNDVKKFPGLVDKRDRLLLIDYDKLSVHSSVTKSTSTNEHAQPRRSAFKTPVKPKIINPDAMFYVHVKTINEGQHFGLTDILFPNQPILTLVSNECECILLNKSSFIHLASDQFKQSMRRSEIPFPNDLAFYKTYHTNEMWRRFSKHVYLDAFSRVNQQHPTSIKHSPSLNERKHHQQQQTILIGAV